MLVIFKLFHLASTAALHTAQFQMYFLASHVKWTSQRCCNMWNTNILVLWWWKDCCRLVATAVFSLGL